VSALVILGTSATAIGVDSAAAAVQHDASASMTAEHDDAEARKCRWVKRIGLVCDTELSTVNI
jgi:hypothetical protein